MAQNNMTKQIPSSKKTDNFLDSVNKFINDNILNAPKQDKIAYGLIAGGVVFIIIGIILW